MFNWFDNKISVKLPVQPYNELFEKMSDNQMASMKNKLINLRDILNIASNASYTTTACSELRKVFGVDFPEA